MASWGKQRVLQLVKMYRCLLLPVCYQDDRIITSNEWDRLQKHLKKRHEKRKALLKAGLGTIANKMSMGNRSKNIPAEVDSDEV